MTTIKSDYITPLFCWDIYSTQRFFQNDLNRKRQDISILKDLQARHQWNMEVEGLLEQSYDALVLTGKDITIEWVNEGFHTMTGYSLKEVKGKNPNLLQGEETTQLSVENVKHSLEDSGSFSQDIINYRKSGERYLCRIEVFPLLDKNQNITHYLAMETEIR